MFQSEGFSASRIRAGADGGVDLILKHPDGSPAGIVQCKAWNTYRVGVKPVRELYGVMAAEGAPKGHFVCSGSFTQEAGEWAKNKPMELISGAHLLERLNRLDPKPREALLTRITAGDYTTPTCPKCDIKLVKRCGTNGEFWGCSSYPRCRQTMKIVEG